MFQNSALERMRFSRALQGMLLLRPLHANSTTSSSALHAASAWRLAALKICLPVQPCTETSIAPSYALRGASL